MGETDSKKPLPDYECPPVIEVVCGVQFEPIPQFQATSLGLFWNRIRDRYPTSSEMPELAPVIEQFGKAPVAQHPTLELSSTPPWPRMFFINSDSNWLIQLQRDRFLHNWRKVGQDDVYPHYPTIFKTFWDAWIEFKTFCEDERFVPPKVTQCEITYINHILAGQGWNSLDDIGQVFPDITWRAKRGFLPPPESAAWRFGFVLPGAQGRLHASVRHAIRVMDERPVLLCELTARGMPTSPDDTATQQWFNLGREWIVRGFADLVADGLQREIWRRKV